MSDILYYLLVLLELERYTHYMLPLCIIFSCTSISVIFTQSVIAKGKLTELQEKGLYVPVFINFSAQTNSIRTQEIIESKLEKKRKTVLGEFIKLYTLQVVKSCMYIFTLSLFLLSIGAPAGKHVAIFVDDLNMPKLDRYGSQPPIELLRQYQDFGGFYDREKLFWKQIKVKRED